MKKIILIPSNTDLNRGDQALVWESINVINDVCRYNHEETKILLVQSGSDNSEINLQTNQTRKQGYDFIVPLLKHPGRHIKNKTSRYGLKIMILWGMQALIDLLTSSLLLVRIKWVNEIGKCFLDVKQVNALQKFKRADAIFVKGGGMIHSYDSITDIYTVYYLMFQIMVAIRYGKDVYILPNSIGPLKNKLVKLLVGRILKRCKLVTVRENISYKIVHDDLKIPAYRFYDLGFYLTPSNKDWSFYLKDKGVPIKEKKCVVVTMRPYRFAGYENAERLYSNYIASIVNLVSNLVKRGYHVTFFAHTLGPSVHEDDRIALRNAISQLSEPCRKDISYIEDESLTCEDVEKIYSYYNFMVGTRFHSVIFSLNVGVPAIAIAYGGNKSRGIMRDIGLEDFVLNIDELHDNSIIECFIALEKRKDEYLRKLENAKNEIANQREALLLTIVRRMYNTKMA
jgi:colanic acid/amylovoran biosynthesis protein